MAQGPDTASGPAGSIETVDVGSDLPASDPDASSYEGKLKELSVTTASITDPPDDAQVSGTVPDFVEIVGAEVQGLGDQLALTLDMSGPVPQTMPDDTTYLIVSWNLAPNKKIPTAGFTAQAGKAGWTVAAGIDNDVVDYPGEVVIDGDRISLVMPWKFVGHPHSFDWSAAASWSSMSQESQAGSGDNVTEGRFPGKHS